MEVRMLRLWSVAATIVIFSVMFVAGSATAAGGCGAGLYRGSDGLCRFHRAASPASQNCAVGYIWRNGRCRQNVENDPFVSTWPNAPR